jgi:ABC-2 type transport system permease protein
MKAFSKLAIAQAKLYLREPLGVFFTLLFGPTILVFVGLIFGNDPDPLFGGLGQMDISVPSYAAMVIAITGMTTVPISIASRRETQVLRRFAATPLPSWIYIFSDILIPFVMTLAGITLLVLMGKYAFQAQFRGNPLAVLGGICLIIGAFFALGYSVSGLIKSSRSVIIVGNVILYPMMFFSGTFMPMEIMPAGVQVAAKFNPMTHAVSLLRELWFGGEWRSQITAVIVLLSIAVVGFIIAALTFRWE